MNYIYINVKLNIRKKECKIKMYDSFHIYIENAFRFLINFNLSFIFCNVTFCIILCLKR